MKSLENAIKDIERDLVINITLNIRYGRISLKEAREIAREFITSYPYESKKDLFVKVDQLSDKYKLVRKVYVKHVPDYESEESEKTLKEMRQHMKNNDFENAIKSAKGGEQYGR